ncbi:MAG: uracil-DNA glycosylase [Comamonadaceae bacterium]|nr:MAG: uracil-DNA glycosylase [Comamonadaceae bacterium]
MFERVARRVKTIRNGIIAKAAEIIENLTPEPAQRCADPAYVRELERRIYDPHVKPINQLVDQLRAEHPNRFVPYVAPTFGGTNARLLALFQSPGPRADPRMGGSGMLCVENDDPTAARHKGYLELYDIDVRDVVSWNTFPWPGNDKYRSLKEQRLATEALEQLLELLPDLEVVMLHGRVAQDAWERLRQHNPYAAGRFCIIETYHTSARLVDPQHNSQSRIDKYESSLHNAFDEASIRLQGRGERAAWSDSDPRD